MNDENELLIDDAPDGKAGVRLLTLNRPARMNALSSSLTRALTTALEDADEDEAVRAVVITGAGDKAFCAGGDLNGMEGEGFFSSHEARRAFMELLVTFRRLKTPTVAAVNGACLGGGFGLMLACDFAVAREDAKLGSPEVRRGLFPMMIARAVYETLPRRVANELVLLGETLDGRRAHEVGAVNRSVPAGAVLEEALSIAERLAALSSSTLALGRRAVNDQLDMPFEVALSHLHGALSLNLETDDAKEGIAAFLGKRPPKWSGR